MRSFGFMVPIYSEFQVVSHSIPIRARPTPAWAKAEPQADRGRPRARRNETEGEERNKAVRSARSLIAPAMTEIASPIASGASALPPLAQAQATAIAINAAIPAASRRCAAP